MRLKTKVFKDLYRDTLLDICEELCTPKAAAIAIALRYIDSISTDDLKSIMKCDPNKYFSPDAYFRDAQAIALLKKTEMFPIRYDNKNTLEYYAQSEQIASEMSTLWRQKNAFSFEDVSTLNRATQIIHSILGSNVPDIADWRFGKGASYALNGIKSGLIPKMQTKPEVTYQAKNYVYRNLQGTIYTNSFSRSEFGPPSLLPIVPGDRLALVSKEIFKPRIMAIQPLGNMCSQLGIEGVLRRKFYRYSGIDITTQPEIHHDLLGDVFGTIDLSSASDSICTELVEYLLPQSWFETLDMLRCKHTVVEINGSKILKPNRKFMAQGNGFTFMLETIIFYSLTLALCEKYVSDRRTLKLLIGTYGDDILVPIHCHEQVCNFLERIGFSVNKDKSFGTESPFKESCGVDIFCSVGSNPVNVRPVYFKEFKNDIGGINLLCNSVTRISEWFYGKCVLAGKFLRAHRRIITTLRKYGIKTYYGFRECSEESFIWSTVRPKVTYRGGICYIQGVRSKPEYHKFSGNPFEDLAAVLYGVPSTGSVKRGSGRYTRFRLAFNQKQSVLLCV